VRSSHVAAHRRPRHAQEIRRLFIDRLSAEQLNQLADISNTILGNLEAGQPSV
jgi:hypothetical protein